MVPGGPINLGQAYFLILDWFGAGLSGSIMGLECGTNRRLVLTNERTNVLVLCTGNSCRSQMAEGFFRSLGDSKVATYSAGLTTHGLNPLAIKTMAKIGVDISGQTSDALEKYLNDRFDYIITVCDNAAENCPVFPGDAKRLHWPFDDPAQAVGSEEDRLLMFAKIRDAIGRQVREFLEELS